MIVLDASAVLELLLGTPTGLRVAGRIASPNETLHGPHLLDLEVAQVLRRYTLGGAVTVGRCEQALRDLDGLGITRYPHDALLPRIWALRHNVSAYDAAYLTLAEALEAPLVTTDERLSRAPGHVAVVEVIEPT